MTNAESTLQTRDRRKVRISCAHILTTFSLKVNTKTLHHCLLIAKGRIYLRPLKERFDVTTQIKSNQTESARSQVNAGRTQDLVEVPDLRGRSVQKWKMEDAEVEQEQSFEHTQPFFTLWECCLGTPCTLCGCLNNLPDRCVLMKGLPFLEVIVSLFSLFTQHSRRIKQHEKTWVNFKKFCGGSALSCSPGNRVHQRVTFVGDS